MNKRNSDVTITNLWRRSITVTSLLRRCQPTAGAVFLCQTELICSPEASRKAGAYRSSPVSRMDTAIDTLWDTFLREKACRPTVKVARDEYTPPREFRCPNVIKQAHWMRLLVSEKLCSVLQFKYSDARRVNADFAAEIIGMTSAMLNQGTRRAFEDKYGFVGTINVQDQDHKTDQLCVDRCDYAMQLVADVFGCRPTELVTERVFKSVLLSENFKKTTSLWRSRIATANKEAAEREATEVEEKKRADADEANRVRAAALAKQLAENEAKRRADAEEAERVRAAALAQQLAEAEAKRRADAEEAERVCAAALAQQLAEAEAKRRADAEEAERVRAAALAKQLAESEAKRRADAEEAERVRADAFAKQLAEDEAKRRADAEEAERVRADAFAKQLAEDEAKRRADTEEAERVRAAALAKQLAESIAPKLPAKAMAKKRPACKRDGCTKNTKGLDPGCAVRYAAGFCTKYCRKTHCDSLGVDVPLKADADRVFAEAKARIAPEIAEQRFPASATPHVPAAAETATAAEAAAATAAEAAAAANVALAVAEEEYANLFAVEACPTYQLLTLMPDIASEERVRADALAQQVAEAEAKKRADAEEAERVRAAALAQQVAEAEAKKRASDLAEQAARLARSAAVAAEAAADAMRSSTLLHRSSTCVPIDEPANLTQACSAQRPSSPTDNFQTVESVTSNVDVKVNVPPVEAKVHTDTSTARRKRKNFSTPSSPPSRRTRHSTGVSALTTNSMPCQEWNDDGFGKVVIPVGEAKSHRDVEMEVTSSHIEYVCNGRTVKRAFPEGYVVDAYRATTKWDPDNKTITIFCPYTRSA
jgi:hypothetical protein